MNAPQVQVGWLDYLAVAARRRWFFLVPFVAVLFVGLLVALFAPRIYEAQALIAVQNEKLINPLIKDLAVATSVSDRLNTLREEILSWPNLTRLIKLHQLDKDLPVNQPLALEKLVADLRKDIKVKMNGASLILVSYEGRDPANVQKVVNSLTDIVIERDAAIQEEQASTAADFIKSQLTVYRQKLEESERKLREFKEVYMTQMPVATALNEQLKGLELQLSRLLVDNTEDHPQVIAVKRQIEEVRRRRDTEVQSLVQKGVIIANSSELKDPAVQAKAKKAYQGIVQQLEAPAVLQSTGPAVAVSPQGTTITMSDAAASTLTLAPRQQQELTSLTRDYAVNETIYRGLLEKLERAEITGRLGEDKEGGKFAIIDRARLPLTPSKPNLLQVFLAALVGGIALGVASVVLAEYFDQAIQTGDEAAALLDLTVLGAISTIVTEGDAVARRRRIKSWVSFNDQRSRIFSRVIRPIQTWLDRALLRWGL